MELMEYDKPTADENALKLLEKLDSLGGSTIQTIQDMNKYLVALELFKTQRLPLITQLDKEHVEIMTRHDTLIASAQLLFDLPENAPILNLIRTMGNSYMIYQISKDRKARTEVVKILQNEQMEAIRNVGDRLIGRK